MGVQDAPDLAPEFYPVFSSDDLLNIPRYSTATRLLVDGIATRPFAMRTRLIDRLPDHALAARIKAASRLRYGRDVHEVEAEISERLKMGR